MPIHAILGDGKAGLRRAWAARPLGAIGTAEDLPLLKRLAETDPLTRARSGSPRPVDKMLGSASVLGPISYAARPASVHHKETVVTFRANTAETIYVGQYGRKGEFVEELYCGPVPMVGKDDVRIRVYSRDIEMIAQSVLPLKHDPPHFWQPLLRPWNDEPAEPLQIISIRSRPCAAVPLYGCFAPLWAAKTGDEVRLTPGKGHSLPGQLPPVGGYESRYLMILPDPRDALRPPADAEVAKQMPLRLSMADGRFVIESRCVVELNSPAACLLARWWVNNRPVVAPLARLRAQETTKSKLYRKLRNFGPAREAATLRVPISLPTTLGPVKAGDRIALQVMYCPAGFVETDAHASARVQTKAPGDDYLPAFQPMLSNRLEFKAGEADEWRRKNRDRPLTTSAAQPAAGAGRAQAAPESAGSFDKQTLSLIERLQRNPWRRSPSVPSAAA